MAPELVTFCSAEAIFLLTRSREIRILIKSKRQRTSQENKETDRGILRSIVLEMLIFVPVSAELALMLFPIILRVSRSIESAVTTGSKELVRAIYGLLGIVSYGFPYATLRRIITRIALSSLKEFSCIADEEHRGTHG